MKETDSSSLSRPPVRSAFVTRLSWILVVLTTVLALFSIITQLTDLRSFDFTQATDVRSTQDAETLQNVSVSLVVFLLLFWGSLIYASWSLGCRRNWARKATVALSAFLMLWFTVIGVESLLFIFGVIRVPFLQDGSPKGQVHVILVVSTLVCIAMDYLCWRVFKELRSADVVREFKHEA
jgi:magnesium-transporting ATPase (P-type)